MTNKHRQPANAIGGSFARFGRGSARRLVKEFFERETFCKTVDLNDAQIIKAMSTVVAHYVCVDVFRKALQAITLLEQAPELLEPARWLSGCQPFPWSRSVWEGAKCVFNLVPCDNNLERTFAKFLDSAADARAFSKLPRAFAFSIEYTDTNMNLRNYEPDFVATDESNISWLLETKGQENAEVIRKDKAAIRWCENAPNLTKSQWRFLKIPQKEFETLGPARLQT